MTRRGLLVVAVAVCVSASLHTPRLEAQAARTGTIQGHIRLTGPAPGNPVIRMGADPMCGRANGGKRVLQEIFAVGAQGALANVFVHLQGTFPATPVPAAPVVIDQQGCIFVPRVVGARTGQALQVKNSDPTAHTVHSSTTKGNEINVSQPKAGIVSTVRMKNEETMLRLRCDIHSWMVGYVGVVPHPYFAVSDRAGAFTIASVPPGRHTIRIWHEFFGAQTATVDVKAGQTATADFTFTGKERPAA